LRRTLGLARAPEFEDWLARMQIAGADGHLLPTASGHRLPGMEALGALGTQ
jgi:ethanolamine ammonia-lyase large subunit